jgi:uncharacterized protein (DUF2141 family)
MCYPEDRGGLSSTNRYDRDISGCAPRTISRIEAIDGFRPGDLKANSSSMRVQGIAWFVLLTFANLLSSAAFAQTSPCPGIHVKILNIRNRNGTVDCALFDSPAGFPREFLRSAQNVMVIKIRNTAARCDFEAIPPGTYALAIIHDENSNGKLDTNLFGVPTEGYAFSNDVTALVGTPSFSAASFSYNGQSLDMTISLHY